MNVSKIEIPGNEICKSGPGLDPSDLQVTDRD